MHAGILLQVPAVCRTLPHPPDMFRRRGSGRASNDEVGVGCAYLETIRLGVVGRPFRVLTASQHFHFSAAGLN